VRQANTKRRAEQQLCSFFFGRLEPRCCTCCYFSRAAMHFAPATRPHSAGPQPCCQPIIERAHIIGVTAAGLEPTTLRIARIRSDVRAPLRTEPLEMCRKLALWCVSSKSNHAHQPLLFSQLSAPPLFTAAGSCSSARSLSRLACWSRFSSASPFWQPISPSDHTNGAPAWLSHV
jgi:hypothetical protein